MRLSQLLTEDGEIIVSADAMGIIREARERRPKPEAARWPRRSHAGGSAARIAEAGLAGITWPTSQSNSMRTAASCCLTKGRYHA